MPSDASKLGDFQKIMKLSSEFESVLKEMMFISASDSEDKRLTNFAENVEVHFAFRKKTEILAKARNFLLRCDFVVSPVRGHFSPIHLRFATSAMLYLYNNRGAFKTLIIPW